MTKLIYLIFLVISQKLRSMAEKTPKKSLGRSRQFFGGAKRYIAYFPEKVLCDTNFL